MKSEAFVCSVPSLVEKENEHTNKLRTQMTTLEIKGDWNIIKGTLKQKWAQLTEDDLQYTEGKAEEMIGIHKRKTL